MWLRRGVLNFFCTLPAIFLLSISCAIAESPSISEISPMEGWAGTSETAGTLVKITGYGFDDPRNLEVEFSGGVTSPVVMSDLFELVGSFGSEGGQTLAPGELEIPIQIAYVGDAEGFAWGQLWVTHGGGLSIFLAEGIFKRNIIDDGLLHPGGVTGLYSKSEVFVSDSVAGNIRTYDYYEKDFKYSFGGQYLEYPVAIDVSNDGILYVVDNRTPTLQPQSIFVFDVSGEATFDHEIQLPSSSFRPIDIEYYDLSKTLYVLALKGNNDAAILKHSAEHGWQKPIFLPLRARAWGLAMGQGEKVFVSIEPTPDASGSPSRVLMLNSSGQIETMFDRFDVGREARGLAVLPYGIGSIYVVDSALNFVREFEPAEERSIYVHVPPGARSGPLTIRNKFGGSEIDFDVLDESNTFGGLIKAEVTQGLASYPLVRGKETLVWVMMDGMFGNTSLDDARIVVNSPTGTRRIKHVDHVELDTDKNISILHFHIDNYFIRDEGTYNLEVEINRGDQVAVSHELGAFEYFDVRGINIAVIKLTGTRSEDWAGENYDFNWFDNAAFYRAMRVVRSRLPTANVSYRFVNSAANIVLAGGLNEVEADALDFEIGSLMGSAEFAGGWRPNAVVAFVDPNYWNLSKVAGYRGKSYIVMPGVTREFSRTLAHELGHKFGLVPRSQSNYFDTNGGHSNNPSLAKEKSLDGFEVVVWDPILDTLSPADQISSMMHSQGGNFFESLDGEGKHLDYHFLFERLRK